MADNNNGYWPADNGGQPEQPQNDNLQQHAPTTSDAQDQQFAQEPLGAPQKRPRRTTTRSSHSPKRRIPVRPSRWRLSRRPQSRPRLPNRLSRCSRSRRSRCTARHRNTAPTARLRLSRSPSSRSRPSSRIRTRATAATRSSTATRS